MISFWCNYCESSKHDVHNCPCRICVDATCASLGKIIHELTNKMIETTKEKIARYSQCFNQSMEDYNLHESNSSLGSLEPPVSFCDDFRPFIQSRPDLHDDMSFPNLKQENDLSMSLFHDLAGLDPKHAH